MQEHIERLRDTWGWHSIALDDSLVCLATAYSIVRLNRQDFLEDMRSTECLKCPNLHLSETLSTELCFTAERLLGDE